MVQRLLSMVSCASWLALGTASAFADAPREAPPPRPATGSALPIAKGKASPSVIEQVMKAYRHHLLATAEDYYGAAAVLAASKDARNQKLARDLGMAAMEKGFGPGYRLALGAHRRLMRDLGIRRDSGPVMRPPKQFVLAPSPKPNVAVAAT